MAPSSQSVQVKATAPACTPKVPGAADFEDFALPMPDERAMATSAATQKVLVTLMDVSDRLAARFEGLRPEDQRHTKGAITGRAPLTQAAASALNPRCQTVYVSGFDAADSYNKALEARTEPLLQNPAEP